MYELIRVSERCYYIESLARIGLVKTGDKSVCLIDGGSDKDAGRRVRQILDREGWTLDAIYVTHSNADHVGGCGYLQVKTGCKIYAKGVECVMTRHPILEPAFIYGGYPYSELRGKFLLAQESDCEYLNTDTLPEGFEIIPLSGHFFDMVGYRVDDVVYLADCLSSKSTLDKYGITFIYDVEAYLESLEKVKNMKARLFIPSHTEALEDIAPLAQYNIDKVNEIADRIAEICSEAKCFETILKELFDIFSLTMTHQQYVLVGSTVRSYLSYLKEKGRLSVEFSDNMMLWKQA